MVTHQLDGELAELDFQLDPGAGYAQQFQPRQFQSGERLRIGPQRQAARAHQRLANPDPAETEKLGVLAGSQHLECETS